MTMSRNGGMLLEELLHSCDGKYNPFRIFSAKDIANATNNYDEQFEDDCWFKMYKGSFNGRQIYVKSFNSLHTFDVKGFAINEIVFASQLNHHNHILMLLGCCLETQAPILVYEYAENGALSDHIFESESHNHDQHQHQLLPWDCRLKVAKEFADALAYLHTGLSMPIIHRNVQRRNIYLNGNYDAKLSDFSLSISIPPGEEYVETDEIRGTFIAPEYFQTRQLTDKCDVYSFGALMLEILSGQRISTLSVRGSEKYIHQACMEAAEKYIGRNNMPESLWMQLSASTELALKCNKDSPEERPTMKEAAQELRRIIQMAVK